MRSRHQILYLLLVFLFLSIGCAKRISINYDEIKPNALVKIRTLSGQTFDGEIQGKNIDYLLLKMSQNDNRLKKIKRKEIAAISGREFVYDGVGEIISEWEIQEQKNNKNLLLYTIGGAGLSFGASFFIGSLIQRSLDDDSKNSNQVLWGTTALGTAVGSFLFVKTGKNRDRNLAIEKIREEHFNAAKKKYNDQKKKHDLVQKELEKEKAEQEKQAEELKLLQDKVKNKKQK